ncbi:MAG: hypothetical protein WC548_04405 [Candidatus Pacearchaeota archaeon]
MKKGRSFWDILAWIVLAGIILWLILKVLGIINTSILLEYAPYFGAVYLAGWYMQKLENVCKEVEGLKKFKDATIQKINNIESNCKFNHNEKA